MQAPGGSQVFKPKSLDSKFYVQSINRAFAIVDEVSRVNERGLSLSEIAEKIGLPVSTVYRIVRNLVAWQYLAEREDGNYALGFNLLSLGNIVKQNLTLANYARRFMEELGAATRETIYLAVLDRAAGDIIYIDKVESHRNIKLAAGVGSRNYIHSTANGKCLVSRLSNDRIKELLAIRGMPALTERTLTDPAAFLREVDAVRRRGYALDDLENEAGVRCVAAPVCDYTGSVVAAISISGVETTMDTAAVTEVYPGLVREAALKISQKMGYDG